jgi:nitrite reductase (NO-forming)
MFFGWFWLLLVPLAIVAVVLVARSGDGGDDSGRHAAEEDLARRYADGEIDEQEYRERSTTLTELRPRRGQTSWWPLAIAIGAIILLIAGLLWGGMGSGRMWNTTGRHMGWTSSNRAVDSDTQPFAAANEVDVTAGDLWFEPTNITLDAGEPTNLTLTNSGRVFHDLTIPDLDVTLGADPGDTVTTGISIDEPGTYEFLCTVPGHADAGMRGTVAVG